MVLFACRTFGISWPVDASSNVEIPPPSSPFPTPCLPSTILFSLANIGEGDTIWTTIGPACLATCLWFAAWICLEAATHVSEAIVVERDTAVGFRLGALLLANGAILGRSVAGDWNGTAPMLADLSIQACPVVITTAMAMMLQIATRPGNGTTKPRPHDRSSSARSAHAVPGHHLALAPGSARLMIATAFNSLHATAAISEDARARLTSAGTWCLHGCKCVGSPGRRRFQFLALALVLPDNQWRQLATWAESLAHETLTAEEEILHRPELWKILAIPRASRRAS